MCICKSKMVIFYSFIAIIYLLPKVLPTAFIQVLPSTYIRIGDKVKLICKENDDEQTGRCQWAYNGQLLDIKQCILEFHFMKKANEGDYSCKTENETSANIRIELFGPLIFEKSQRHNYYGDIGTTTHINIRLFSSTNLSSVILRGDNFTVPINIQCSEQNINTSIHNHRVTAVGYGCKFELKPQKSTEFQNYTLSVTNEEVTKNFTFSLQQKSHNEDKQEVSSYPSNGILLVLTVVFITVCVVLFVAWSYVSFCKDGFMNEVHNRFSQQREGLATDSTTLRRTHLAEGQRASYGVRNKSPKQKTKNTPQSKHRLHQQRSNTELSSSHNEEENGCSTLNYVHVEFDSVETKRKFSIRGAENKTAYIDIDFSAHAEPIPSSAENESDDSTDSETNAKN